VLQPRFGEGPLEDSRPPRVANMVGLAFLWVASLAYVGGATTIGAILGGIVAAADRYGSGGERPVIRIAGVTLNVLALLALTLEVSDYFRRQITPFYAAHNYSYTAIHQIQLARRFSYSLFWLAYGAALMLFGFKRRSAFVRWQALVLIAVTIGKVFLYDVSELQQGYRILSFIALGAVLMGISYVYHRDWLKLTPQTEANSTQAPLA